MQIDFGYVLNEYPGGVHFDMPRLTMPIALVDRFNAEPGGNDGTLMNDLQHDMLAAYLVLRRHSDQLIPFCAHLMSSSYDYKPVQSILKGRHVFRKDRSEKKVTEWISQKLTTQWAHFYFRREIKQRMVSGYYKFVETFENSGGSSSNNHKLTNFKGTVKSFFQSRGGTNISTIDSRGSFESSDRDDRDDSEEESEDNDGTKSSIKIDMSRLNERVIKAMKLQKEVSTAMISQNDQHGTLDYENEDDDGGEVRSGNSA